VRIGVGQHVNRKTREIDRPRIGEIPGDRTETERVLGKAGDAAKVVLNR
jgi:hypothetical protein